MRFNLSTRRGRLWAWLYAMFQEHNFTNLFRFNFHRISDNTFRSSQPTMWQLRRVVRQYGIKTIINLKGANLDSAYWAFEREQCEKLGVKLIDVEIKSRGTPWPEDLRRAKSLFESIEYPMWMHCKAGADRTGIYATFFQYFHQHIPIERTNQLRLWPYGHIRHSQAGKIDNYLEKYLAYRQLHPEVGLLEWAEQVADRDQIDREYRPFALASFINDRVLHRE
jgi:protein tyrosine/serine phosphatase